MKIPEKINIPIKDGKMIGLVKEYGIPFSNCDENVEYIRTDAFIEKAVNWLKHSLDNGCWIASDVGEQEKDAIIEHFKKTMKLKE